jgi:hypothetical protein
VVGINSDITWGLSSSEVSREVSMIKQAGVGSVRVGVDLSGAEYNGPGQLNTSYLSSIDSAISTARDAGMNVLLELDRTPYWASADPSKYTNSSGMHWNPYWRYSNPQDYARVVGDVVNHYREMGVHAYEVWNEPNNPSFWPSGVNAAEYTALLQAAYPAIKAADPSATVLMAGLMNQGSYEYLQGMYNAGARGSYDVASFHIYPGDPNQCATEAGGRPSVNSFCLLDGLRSVMAANGDGAPVWVTELGWSTCTQSFCVTQQQQADYLTSAYQLLSTPRYSYVQDAFVYEMRDPYWESSNTSWESSLGMLNRDWSPKPAYAALQALATGTARGPGSGATPPSGPTVQLTSPGSGATIGKSVSASATAADAQGVTKVTFSIDGKTLASDTIPPYSATLSTRKLAGGSHTVTATAHDAAGRTASSSVTVRKGTRTTFSRTTVSLRIKRTRPRLGASVASATRHLDAIGRVRGSARGRVTLVLSHLVAGRWKNAGVLRARLSRRGRYADVLSLVHGVWRLDAVYGSARSRGVTVHV